MPSLTDASQLQGDGVDSQTNMVPNGSSRVVKEDGERVVEVEPSGQVTPN